MFYDKKKLYQKKTNDLIPMQVSWYWPFATVSTDPSREF